MRDRLRPLWCDQLSIVRGKYLPQEKIGSGYTRFAQPCLAVHYDKDLIVDAPGTATLEGLPDMELHWAEEDIRRGWEPGVHVVTGDLYDRFGQLVPVAGRAVLKKAIADWGKHGLTPKVGIELEAFAFTRDAEGNLQPYDVPGGYVYGTGPFNDPVGFTDAIWEAAEDAGFALELITTEYDTPQFEFTLTFDEALKAIDDVVQFRLLAREVAWKHGILLTFLPKPLFDRGGSGMHINLSFADAAGNNALANGDRGGIAAMNGLAKGCVAGWMAHHKGLAALTAPTVNSYARLQPASMSGYWCNWGEDHRGVTVRVSGEGGKKARLEHRMADASSNPYAAVAAVLQAARLGFEGGYALPASETGDCFTGQDAAHGVAGSLAEALDDLQADTALIAALGPDYVAHHVHMKRVEVEKQAEKSDVEARDFYIWYV
ncbi:MAG: glutamine synthetase [Rhodobacter sp.]|nr:glutamine synthetase [Paracoccaceae bacterium]MCC0075130.1 glutamine synthetase [Rhodobacter sp.]